MTPTNDKFRTDYTPEELSALLAEHKNKFTADDLYGYIEDDSPTIPARQVLEEAKALVEEIKRQKAGGQA